MTAYARQQRSSPADVLAFFGLLAMFFGGFFTLCMLGFRYQGSREASWMVGEGRVDRASLSQEVRRPGSKVREKSPASSLPEWVIAYSYMVDGNRYSGASRMGTQGGWQIGAPLKVYYDPGNPSRSTLRRSDTEFFEQAAPLFGAVFVAGLLLYLPAWVRRRRSGKSGELSTLFRTPGR